MNKHIFAPFDHEIDSLKKNILMMGEEVTQQFLKALDSLQTKNTIQIEQVVAYDKKINRDEIYLDNACVELIVRYSPAAGDLRLVTAMMRTIGDLERVGDEAKKIAKLARKFAASEQENPPGVKELRYHSDIVLKMLHQALDAFARLDPTEVQNIFDTDETIDTYFKQLKKTTVSTIAAASAPSSIELALDLLFMAKSIERIGDHATNIAENVIFVIEGHEFKTTG